MSKRILSDFDDALTNNTKTVALTWMATIFKPGVYYNKNDEANGDDVFIVQVGKWSEKWCRMHCATIVARWDSEKNIFVAVGNNIFHEKEFQLSNSRPPEDISKVYALAWAFLPGDPGDPFEWEYEDEQSD